MNTNINKEIRRLNGEIRSESRHIEGYAIVFNSQSDDLGFYETILPTAIDDELLRSSDVFALFNHDKDKVLARSKYGFGNLHLTIDNKGLKYEFDALNNELGNTVLEYIRSGIVDSSSFAFCVADDGDNWERRDGKLYRTITKIGALMDVSPVFEPAYSEASCTCRSLDRFLEDEKKKELIAKYDKMIDEIKNLN